MSSKSSALLLQRFDRDRSGLCEMGEFAALATALRATQLDELAKELAHAQGQLQTASRVPDDVRAVFERFDVHRSGRLDYKELRNALQAMKMDHEAKHAEALLAEFDRDRNGTMDVKEFHELIGALRRTHDGHDLRSLRAGLKERDDELAQVRGELARLQQIGVPQDVRQAFEKFDANKSGK